MTSEIEVDETVNVGRHEYKIGWKVPCVGYHECGSMVKAGKSEPKALKPKGVAPELVATE